MLKPKRFFLPPLLIWTVIILGSILIAQNAVKRGYISIDLSRNLETTGIPTPIPSFIPKQIETPNPQPTVIPIAIPTLKPTVKPLKQNVQQAKQPLPILSGSNIFNMVNAFRMTNGKPGLSVSDELCRLAEARADYMMANGMTAFKSSTTGGHTGFTDVSSQYSGSGVGENLAANSATDASVIEIWKNSPPHRDLMLWTEKGGFPITKGCLATRVSEVGSIAILLVGDK